MEDIEKILIRSSLLLNKNINKTKIIKYISFSFPFVKHSCVLTIITWNKKLKTSWLNPQIQ